MSYRLVTRFADDMARELDANSHKGGWHNMTTGQLLRRVKQELRELEKEVRRRNPDFKAIRSEAADVGNFLAMLVWNACEEASEREHARE